MDTTIGNNIQRSLVNGENIRPLAVLSAVAIGTVIPLTFIKKIWSISVGYGASVATMSLVLIWAFRVPAPSITTMLSISLSRALVFASLLYGLRLTGYLLLRLVCVKSMEKQGEQAEAMSRVKSTVLAVFVSILYAAMVLPVVYALREDDVDDDGTLTSWRSALQIVGVITCYIGLFIEAIADQQKYNTKRHARIAYGDSIFSGPTGGLYTLCRHPNYLGELLFWVGLYIGGAVCFPRRNIVAPIFSTLGLWSIISIMFGSTKRLEKKQQDMYGKQVKFQEWRDRVRAPLIPFIEREMSIAGMK